jgi:tRNA threonylcarbamoyl adenosine modification protein (Sua5/YciO/YrdC/YwlC family)
MISIDEAVQLLRQGEIVGVPTDTVYGLAVDPRLPSAAMALYDLKGRPEGRPMSLLVASATQARRIAMLPEAAERAAATHWPGALTMVVRWRRPLPEWVGDHERGTIGVRVPDHPVTLAVLDAAGPLAVTSANRSGEPPALDHEEAEVIFGADIAGYLEGASPGGEASTVVDFTVEPPRLLREGPVAL